MRWIPAALIIGACLVGSAPVRAADTGYTGNPYVTYSLTGIGRHMAFYLGDPVYFRYESEAGARCSAWVHFDHGRWLAWPTAHLTARVYWAAYKFRAVARFTVVITCRLGEHVNTVSAASRTALPDQGRAPSP